MLYCEVNVGERSRYFRNLRGWSQEALALQAEINPAFLGHLERGLKSPTIKTLEKIVRALDISLAELFADFLSIVDVLLVLELMIETCPEIHCNRADLNFDANISLLFGEIYRNFDDQVVTAIAV